MKLIFRFRSQQFLFLLTGIAWLGAAGAALADVLVMSDGRRLEGRVLGVQGSTVQLQTQAGTIGWPLANVREVQMPVPPELGQAQQAFAAKDYNKALTLARALSDKFKGLPTDWAQLATGMLGDIYVATADLAKAEAAYKEFQRLYPGGGSLQAEVGMARIAASKKDFATAKQKLEPVAEKAVKEKNVSRAHPNAIAYSQTFLVLGQVKESEGKHAEALEDYLRTVAIFFHDPSAVTAAQERADALRKEHKVTVP